jgi:peptidoglycan hydrolase-like amidase
VRNVVPSEWAPWWLPASLQAGALAVKTRGWYWVNHFGGYLDTPDNCFDVTDDTQFQRYIPGNTTTATDAAVNATWPVLALQGGAIFPANFRADLSTVGEGCGVAVDGTTLSQWGTQACATQGMSAVQMMTRYYRHVFTGSPQASGGAVYDAQGGYHVFTRGPDGTSARLSGTAGWDEESTAPS